MIPAWNISAVLPPIRPGQPGHSLDRSPYVASLVQVIERFAMSPERIGILRGFLAYRETLRQRGILTGFQWLNGSFMEHKEAIQSAPPNDIDVVTFFNLPAGTTQAAFLALNADLFDNDQIRDMFDVDSYLQLIGEPMSPSDVRQVSYWYSMWSHRRNGLWKGFVQVDLASHEDAAASALLTQIELERARQ